MSLDDRTLLDLSELASAAIDGRLEAAGQERLEKFLRESEEARRFYVRMAALSAGLATVAAETQAEGSRPARRWASAWRLPGLAAAALLLAALAFFALGRRAADQEPVTDAVAVLTRAVDVTWADPADARRVESALAPGWIRIRSGLLRIEFHGGARVQVQGPAELRLVSAGEAHCGSGRLVAEVPRPARGFRLTTPSARVVDHGTTFGLDVSADGTGVHVFKGNVEVVGRSGPQDLKAGEAAAVDSAGALRRLPAEPDRFSFSDGLDRSAAEATRGRRAAWRESARRLDADPDLLVHFDFENGPGEGPDLRNAALSPARGTDGALVGGRWTDGRWPGTAALDFSAVSDRVRLHLPGDFRSLTLVAWARVNSHDLDFNGLFMSDGFDEAEVHWQILKSGRVRLGLQRRGSAPHRNYDSPPIFTPEHRGRWVQLATVVDGAAGRVTHYFNGLEVARLPRDPSYPLRVGTAELGNWNPGPASIHVRNLSGGIDEFLFFSRALDAGEIRRLYEEGSP
jgi:hypothetical protein